MIFCKAVFATLLLTLLIVGCGGGSSSSDTPDSNVGLSYRGVDASFANQLTACGAPMLDSDSHYPWLDYSDVGVNLVRLRVWVNPEQGYNNVADTLSKARAAVDAGMEILIDFHYSDTWADPANQKKPAAWADSEFSVLEQQVYLHTLTLLNALADDDIAVAMVQIGNEISSGLLWDEGRVGSDYNQNWWRLARLLKSGVRAVNESSLSKRPQVMIHTDTGGNQEATEWFFSHLISEGVEFDVIGLSYYSWWQGSLDALQDNLNALVANYSHPIMLAEIAHPYSLVDHDSMANFVWKETELNSQYPASEQGQVDHIAALRHILLALPEQRGLGMIYWAPDWTGSDISGCQSSWDNLTLYGQDGRILPGLVELGQSR